MIEQLLVKRYQWEDIVKRYNIPDHNGTIDNLKWFVDHGHQSNRLRRRFKEAHNLAASIIEMADSYNEDTNLPSVRWQEI
jgi:hypothetical protein